MSRCSECGRKDCCGSWMEEDNYKKLKEAHEEINRLKGLVEVTEQDLEKKRKECNRARLDLRWLKDKVAEGLI